MRKCKAWNWNLRNLIRMSTLEQFMIIQRINSNGNDLTWITSFISVFFIFYHEKKFTIAGFSWTWILFIAFAFEKFWSRYVKSIDESDEEFWLKAFFQSFDLRNNQIQTQDTYIWIRCTEILIVSCYKTCTKYIYDMPSSLCDYNVAIESRGAGA